MTAAADPISLGHPHRLFRTPRTTVCASIHGRPLERACRDLTDPFRHTRARHLRTVGFTHPEPFSRLFREASGLSPSSFRHQADSTDRFPPSPRVIRSGVMTDISPVVRQISSDVVYTNAWMTVREDRIEHPDGTYGTYGYVVKPDFVVVIPQQNDGFHLVEEYRYPIGRRCWSFPQGHAEADTREDEARRELAEETGLRAAELRPLGRLDAAHGLVTNGFHVYLATGLVTGDTNREHTEQDMRQQWVSRAEFERMIRAGEVSDACSIAAYSMLRLHERAA
jgi:8-oxo-dGTP pyrophosphatase MutT (NUDIX family)/AraC-like DNA-binding protein